ncbi:LysE family translocator [Sphingomonas sp. G-3-2-10]|uniref:LysE family translocator n=1 Tax=Sphingomonas sp. G-3-2-10 TaxID=2728838 RepID=UPI00146C83E2|nr:LysE family translocator [Sphingomonas sp. G-3-2-10]NML06594.1 LysE family translocator [Sphingomonas sp. G-3-2-10]
MIDSALFAAFLFAAFVLTITPGLDTAMVLRAAASDGARAGVFASIGILVGCLVWGAAVSLGLGALLHASELAYSVLKWAGAAYLLWVGATMLLGPRETMAADAEASRDAGIRAMRRGFLTNMLNPKIGIFYVTFLPQFIPAGVNVAGYSFFLACVHVAITVLWFALLIAATAPLGRMLKRPKVLKSLDRMTGGVFIAFGLKLAASRA